MLQWETKNFIGKNISRFRKSWTINGLHCNENFGTGQKWNGVPILSCKIWHGQENNGMASRTMSGGIAAIKGLSVHALQEGYPYGCSETRKWKNSKFYVRHEVLKKKDQ